MDSFVNATPHRLACNQSLLAQIAVLGNQEPDWNDPMSLVIAVTAETGEIVVTADRRSSFTTKDGEVIVKNDNAMKLHEVAGLIVGVAGKSPYALYVVNENLESAAQEESPIKYLCEKLREHFTSEFSEDRRNWPETELIFCKHTNGRNRIIRTTEHAGAFGFTPMEVDDGHCFAGNPMFATTVYYMMYGIKGKTVEQHQRICAISNLLSSLSIKTVSFGMDIWVMATDGSILKRTADEVKRIQRAADDALKRATDEILAP